MSNIHFSHKQKSGQVNFIQLAINEDKTTVDVDAAMTVSSAQEAAKSIHTGEPRFYVYSQSRGVSASHGWLL